MNSNKCIRSAALALALMTAFSLAACGKKVGSAGVSKDQTDYLKYTFGESCTITQVDEYTAKNAETGEHTITVWDITLPDYSGNIITRELRVEDFTKEDKKLYKNEKVKRDEEVLYFVSERAGEKASAEFFDKLFSQKFGGEYDTENKIWTGDAVTAFITTTTPICACDKEGKVTSKLAAPDSGFSYINCDLKAYACSPDFMLMFTMTIAPDADEAECTEKFHELKADFEAYTGSPKNYFFTLRKGYMDDSGNEKSSLAERYAYVNGEEFEIGGGQNYLDAVYEKYGEIYGIEIKD